MAKWWWAKASHRVENGKALPRRIDSAIELYWGPGLGAAGGGGPG